MTLEQGLVKTIDYFKRKMGRVAVAGRSAAVALQPVIGQR